MTKPTSKYLLLFITLLHIQFCFAQTEFESTNDLYKYLKSSILERDAFSDIKLERLDLDVKASLEKHKKTFIKANTAEDLYFEILKLSNLREDSHLKLKPFFNQDRENTLLPIRLEPEFTDEQNPRLILSEFAYGTRNSFVSLNIGDELVSINGIPYDELVQKCKPFLPASTRAKYFYELAKNLTRNSFNLSRVINQSKMVFVFKDSREEITTQTLNLVPSENLYFDSHRHYDDFIEVMSTTNFSAYISKRGMDIMLFELKDFGNNFSNDVDELMDWAIENRKLHASVIVDARYTDGGQNGVYLLKYLTSRPFRITMGNLKLSDITESFIEIKTSQIETETQKGLNSIAELNDKSVLDNWLNTSVTKSIEAGDAYSENVPFKLMYPTKDDSIHPFNEAFRGRLVVLTSSRSGSQIDQFVSMVTDNKMGHTIGMPTGGYSNTWEWKEKLMMPKTDTVLCEFKWSIGQTIRPNGEPLEGNPANVDDYFPRTKENFEKYDDLIMEKTVKYLIKN
jgi:C-terminal processing protease CtpA/Prc